MFPDRVPQDFPEKFLPETDIKEQAVVAFRGQGMTGAEIDHDQIPCGHVYVMPVDRIDQRAPVKVVQFIIIVAVLRVGLGHIVGDKENISALGELPEYIVEVLHVQDIAGEVLRVVGQFVRRYGLGFMSGFYGGYGHKGERIRIISGVPRSAGVQEGALFGIARDADLHIGPMPGCTLIIQPVGCAEQDLETPVGVVDADMAAAFCLLLNQRMGAGCKSKKKSPESKIRFPWKYIQRDAGYVQ